MGKIDGPGSTYQPAPVDQADGITSGYPDPNKLPANHPGTISVIIPGMAPAGAPVK